MSIENNFFATDSCEWSNANYSECLSPLPQCPVSHFRFLSACRDDLDWKLHDSRIVPPPWSRLTFLPRLAVTWMLVWHLSCFLDHSTHAESGFILLPCSCHSSCSIFSGPSCAPIQVGLGDCDAIHWIVTARIVEVWGLLWLGWRSQSSCWLYSWRSAKGHGLIG